MGQGAGWDDARPIMVCSRARSCSDRTTTCRLRTSASRGGLPGPHEHETEPHTPQATTDELLGGFLEGHDCGPPCPHLGEDRLLVLLLDP